MEISQIQLKQGSCPVGIVLLSCGQLSQRPLLILMEVLNDLIQFSFMILMRIAHVGGEKSCSKLNELLWEFGSQNSNGEPQNCNSSTLRCKGRECGKKIQQKAREPKRKEGDTAAMML